MKPHPDSRLTRSRSTRKTRKTTCARCMLPITTPNVGSEQGFLYLPGKGPVFELNISTIMRGELDGKWSYAMRAWEALIKPAIANAEAGSPQNPKVSEASEAATGGWTKPK